MARAIGSLPVISAAMARGELSYSKVRALSRVATPESEEELLEMARHATAAHIERLLRSWRRVDRLEEAEAEESRHRSRYLTLYPDEDGSWVLRGRLDPEVGTLLQKALARAGEALRCGNAAIGSGPGAPFGTDSKPAIDPKPDTGFRTATVPKRLRDFDTSISNADTGEKADILSGNLPGTFSDTDSRTNTKSGTDAPTATQRCADALRLLAERGLAEWGRDQGTESNLGRPSPSLPVTRADRFQVVLHVDAEALREGSESGQGVLAASGAGVSAETSRRLACDTGVVEMRHGSAGEVLDVGRRRRTVPPAIRRAFEHRDGGCRFPGCGCRYTDAHPIVHWADGGETKLDNLVLLCGRHHRAVREGGFQVEADEPDAGGIVETGPGESDPGETGIKRARGPGHAIGSGDRGTRPGASPTLGLRFSRPDGRLIKEVPDAPQLPGDPVMAFEETHRTHGIEPDAWTATPLWHGEAFDYGLALDMLRHSLAREGQVG